MAICMLPWLPLHFSITNSSEQGRTQPLQNLVQWQTAQICPPCSTAFNVKGKAYPKESSLEHTKLSTHQVSFMMQVRGDAANGIKKIRSGIKSAWRQKKTKTLPVSGVIRLIALRHGAEQPRHLSPHALIQALAGTVVVETEQQRQPEEARLALLLREEVRLLSDALPVHRDEVTRPLLARF